jgi:hypothetical protein
MGHVASVIEQPMGIKAIQLTGKKLTVHRDIPTRERISELTKEVGPLFAIVERVGQNDLELTIIQK